MTEGLRKRTRPGTFIPRAVLRDRRLSFRARGILAHLLDRPAGWDVRAEALAGESDQDGRDAILSALRELGNAGYYRLERRRLSNGQFTMGTAISEEPVAEWAADYSEYGGRAVPVIQQPDGSFMVKHKDGSLTADGFADEHEDDAGPGAPDDDPAPDGGQPDTRDRDTDQYQQVAPGTGFPVPALPVPGLPGPVGPEPEHPDPGPPGSGRPGAIRRTDEGVPKRTSGTEPASQAQYRVDDGKSPSSTRTRGRSRASVQRTEAEQALFDQAGEIARWWWTIWQDRKVPIVGRNFVGLRDSIILAALTARATPEQVRQALTACDEPFPSISKFQNAMTQVVTGGQSGPRPRRGQPANVQHQPNMPSAQQQRIAALFSGSVGGRVISGG